MSPRFVRVSKPIVNAVAILLFLQQVACSPLSEFRLAEDGSSLVGRNSDLAASESNGALVGGDAFSNSETTQSDGKGDVNGDGGPTDEGAFGEPDEEDIIAALQTDTDGDGTSDLDELINGTDPLDPSDGGDIDGDGILNGDDPDVDGDGIPNGEDPDVDGDGIPNGLDDDVDGDGLLAFEDLDDDGDFLPDVIDNDDDGDGEPDCKCVHGECDDLGIGCDCESGWKGTRCDKFTCIDVDDCNFGTCIGPNACGCDDGIESGPDGPCSRVHCRGVGNCNEHGTCTGPNKCTCSADWSAEPDCSKHICTISPMVCDDNDLCTTDECDSTMGCSNTDMQCVDPKKCVGGECTLVCATAADCTDGQGCRGGGCFECEEPSDCNDGDECTTDVCDPDGGCIHDEMICAPDETCSFGMCREVCTEPADCPEPNQVCELGACFDGCSDDNDCNDDEMCDNGSKCIPAEDEDEEGDG